MSPLLHPAPSWQRPRSEYIVLWHGCTALDKHAIEGCGISLDQCAPDSDFGRGFYMTTSRDQAEQWAWSCYYKWQDANPNRKDNWPAVLRFRLRRFAPPKKKVAQHENGVDKLCSLSFVIGDRHNDDYWSLVQHCRLRRDHARRPSGWYDVVSGPVAAFWTQRVAMGGSDQMSFHTSAGIGILNALIEIGLKSWPKGNRRYYTWVRVH